MTYFAFQEHKDLLAMGLHKLDLDDWLIPDRHLPDQVSAKRTLWQEKGSSVFSALPSSADAQLEVARAMGAHLPRRYPELYADLTGGLYCKATRETLRWNETDQALLTASWAVQEDLCILQPVADQYALTAASLCAPSYWRLLDKIGLPLDEVHGPVPGYAEQLSRKVNRFLSFIKPERPVWRGNWSVVTSDRLYQPGGEKPEPITDPQDIPRQCYIRTERQTLRRMPDTGAILFTIRVVVEPLQQYADEPDWMADLLAALDGMSDAERRYKSLHLLEPALSRWLRFRLSGETHDHAQPFTEKTQT